MDLIIILKAFSDENRIRILNLLNHGELCVCEIEYILNMSQSNVSRHLNRLNYAKIIESYKKAQFVYYKLNDDTIKEHRFIKSILNNELYKIRQCKIDLDNLKKYRELKIDCNTMNLNKINSWWIVKYIEKFMFFNNTEKRINNKDLSVNSSYFIAIL